MSRQAGLPQGYVSDTGNGSVGTPGAFVIENSVTHVTGAQTLGALTQAASALVKVTTAPAQTLGALTQATSALVKIHVNGAQTLGTLTQATSALVKIHV